VQQGVADPRPIGTGANGDGSLTVVHVVLSLDAGGLERLVCNLVAAEATRHFRHVVCCLDREGPLAEDVRREGHEVIMIRRGRGADAGLVFRLARFLRTVRADAVHTHSLDPMFYGGLAAALARVPVRIHTQHNTFLSTYSPRDRMKFQIASGLFTRIVSVGAETDRGVAAFGVPAVRRCVIRNGINVGRFDDAPTLRPAAEREATIGVVARLSPEKGVDCLLDALALLAADGEGARLAIVGDGPDRSALEDRARAAGLSDRVDFLGFQPKVATLLPTMDVFALPSRSEGIPLALLEAMAASRPCIATRVGGVPEVIEDGVNGLLVPPEDPAALANAIRRLLKDPTLRDRLGRAALEHVRKEWSEEAMAHGYATLYAHERQPSLMRRSAKYMLRALPRDWISWSGGRRGSLVSLTFDDGPHADFTPRILDILRAHDVRATFFLIGERAEREPGLVARIIDEGHELGNHSFTHPHFEQLSWSTAIAEIDKTERVLARTQRASTGLWRPPRGKLSWTSIGPARRLGLRLVMWTVDLKDFRAASAQAILSRLAAKPLRAGDIILYHGHNDPALEALPEIIRTIRASGFNAVPVTRLLSA
jgi:glycosyltransferase involved in cell wall biosynthesis/peptidoglycan/xylan/chitin deacetylase (PgdA/CDA1 family)